MATTTTVVNLTTGAKYDVYIGRPSQFGNPFKIGRDGTRDEVIAKFERYAAERVMTDAKFASAVKSLYGQRLGCYCFPLKCHGDILIELTEHLNADI